VQSYVSSNPAAGIGCTHLEECHFTTDPLNLAIPDWVRFRAWAASGFVSQILERALDAGVSAGSAVKKARAAADTLEDTMRLPYTEDRDMILSHIDKSIAAIRDLHSDFARWVYFAVDGARA
jgi:hypothetical protein